MVAPETLDHAQRINSTALLQNTPLMGMLHTNRHRRLQRDCTLLGFRRAGSENLLTAAFPATNGRDGEQNRAWTDNKAERVAQNCFSRFVARQLPT